MPRYYLTRISIEGFRGINNDGDPLVIKFKPSAVNSIHAHNGVGKTSIFEAIHYAIFGTVPRLTRMQQAERPDAYVVNRFHPAGQALVELWFEADDPSGTVQITVTRTAAGARNVTSKSGYADPEGFLGSLREDFVLVDYAKFGEFIDASALQRGRSFASLVGLSRYSQLRQALEGASDTRSINTDFDLRAMQTDKEAREREAAESTARALAAYEDITGHSAADLQNVEGLCSTVTAALTSLPMLKSVVGANDVRKIDISAAEQLVEKEEGGPSRARHGAIVRTIGDLNELSAGGAEAAERAEIVRLAVERDTAMAKVGGPMLRELYEQAGAVVSDQSWSNPKRCPVCESALTRPLSEHLRERLDQYAAADEASAALEVAIQKAASISRLGKLEASPALATPIPERVYASTVQSATDHTLPTADLHKAFLRLDELEGARSKAVAELDAERAGIEATLPPSLVAVSRTLTAARQFCDAIAAYAQATTVLANVKEDLALRARWQRFIVQASEAFSVAETRLANDRIGHIEQDYQSLFADLVRGGPDVRPTLERSTGSENVELKLANFHGLADINARAVLSESYRNAVAGSIFLAAALRYNGVPRFVVLDDITSSFDAGHQFSLMEAVRTKLQQPGNPVGLQFIILSHDSALEKYFDKRNGSTDWHHQKLQGMPPIGRVMISAREADRLKVQAQTLLNGGQVDLGAPFVRQYLEYKLAHIISKLDIPCPPDYATRGDKRTLSTYLDAITDAMDLYQAAARIVLTPQQMTDIKTTLVPAIMGNFVSHYETGAGTPFGAYALLGVLQSIDALADCFTWVDNGTGTPTKRFYRRLDRKA